MWVPALWWSRPSPKDEASFLASCQGFNYAEKYVGMTSEPPFSADKVDELKSDGFSINHSRVRLGSGLNTFSKAKDKLQNWRHLQLGSVFVDPSTPIKVGGKFGIHVHELVAWLINPLQILYITDTLKDGQLKISPKQRGDSNLPEKKSGCSAFAFGGGTLRGHLLAGEERFAVEWNKEDDTVWYDIYSFSKPAHFLSIVGFPVVKFQQQQFAKHSSEAMVKEVSEDI
ncbi:unnamed protein product [Calypogeia fissa]